MAKFGERYPLFTRFMKRVVCGANKADCWIWHGALGRHGYGQIRVGGKTLLAHRVAVFIRDGVMPPQDQCVCHSCDERRCVNPDHLWLGSVSDNNTDRNKKGRSRGASHYGENNPLSKLTESDVRSIRAASGKHTDIAKLYGVSFQTVSNIKLRHTWRHVS